MTDPGAHSAQELRERVASVPFWWHRIDLGHGVVTPGEDNSSRRLQRLGMPDDLAGKSVIDVGAWDGFFSFEAERRGASRVVACDRWDPKTGGAAPTGFRVAREALGSKVEEQPGGLEAADVDELGAFDVVLCLGVLYHLKNPYNALRRLRRLTAGLLILDTELDCCFSRRPAVAFYPGDSLRGDPTNWTAPNPAALRAMLLDVGFADVHVRWRLSRPARVSRAVRDARRYGHSPLAGLQRDRIVVHATV